MSFVATQSYHVEMFPVAICLLRLLLYSRGHMIITGTSSFLSGSLQPKKISSSGDTDELDSFTLT